jgi:hypothetical protein
MFIPRIDLCISKENTKLGKVANISLPPFKSCVPGVPCMNDCYAIRSYNRYPVVRDGWNYNLRIYQKFPNAFFIKISEYLSKRRNVYSFRWNVGGDIVDQAYFDGMVGLAIDFPKIAFLAFTKNHGLDFSNRPDNLVVIKSMWPGWGDININPDLPCAWMQDGTETRIPENAVTCNKHCDACFKCWELPACGQDVVFMKH